MKSDISWHCSARHVGTVCTVVTVCWLRFYCCQRHCRSRILKSYSGLILSHFVTIPRRNFDVLRASSLWQLYLSVVFFARVLVLSLSHLIGAVCDGLCVCVLSEKSGNCRKSQTELRRPFQPFCITQWSSIRFAIGKSVQRVRMCGIEWTCDNRLIYQAESCFKWQTELVNFLGDSV
jgi:hypothetical protein